MDKPLKHSAAQPEQSPPPSPPRPAKPPQGSDWPQDFRAFDRVLRAYRARATQGVSLSAVYDTWSDWADRLAMAPGKQLDLLQHASRSILAFGEWLPYAATQAKHDPPAEPQPGDRRFVDPAWSKWPFNAWEQGHLLIEEWWADATHDVPGLERRREAEAAFMMKALVNVSAPSNIPWLNPVILERNLREHGFNVVRGAMNWLDDLNRMVSNKPPAGAERYQVGRDVAVTPGKVVFRNALIELIQYSPTTETVFAEPLLIVPAWIMKYYILDLEPMSSLVRFLVERGHTVFMVSWKNPDAGDRDVGFDDYRRLGVMAALNAVSAIVPNQKIHTCGYCLGGTILTIAAAAMARDNDERIASLTLFASQTDFVEAGEITLFLDEKQVLLLDDMMWDQGYLDTRQMASAFQALRSDELVWSRLIREYFLGERDEMTALTAWNADQTRLPARMHSEYLHELYLENRFSSGRFTEDGKVITMRDIRAPIFAVGTSRDHIAPWRSVYKVALFTDTDVTFALVSGGHNVGIVNPPTQNKGSYQLMTRGAGERYVDPAAWATMAPAHAGSWWPAWEAWLKTSGLPDRVPPPPMGAPNQGYSPLGDAPGVYVMGR